jgi:hypothetical protein
MTAPNRRERSGKDTVVPVLSAEDLHVAADPEQVDRVWARIERSLDGAPRVAAAPRPSRAWLLAACFGALAFAGGVLVGRGTLWGGAPDSGLPTADVESSNTLFATGTKANSFVLPSGSTLTLQPDSLVEVVRSSRDSVTLSLLRGGLSVEGAADQSFAVLAGEARVTAAAGSRVSLTRRSDDVDVAVESGSAEVSSPAGRHRVLSGQSLSSVPTYAWTLSVGPERKPPPDVAPTPSPRTPPNRKTPREEIAPEESPAPVAPAAPVASLRNWRSLANEGQYDAAYEALEEGVGFETTIATAQSASELMSLSEIAGRKHPTLRMRALHRAADEFASEPLGRAAAAELAGIYERTNKELAAKYRQIGSQAPALAEMLHCSELRSFGADSKPAERQHLTQRAVEYVRLYPKGTCLEQAAYILSETKTDASPAPSASASAQPGAAPSASSSSAPSEKPPVPEEPND